MSLEQEIIALRTAIEANTRALQGAVGVSLGDAGTDKPTPAGEPSQPAARPQGRPLGSKNKPAPTPAPAAAPIAAVPAPQQVNGVSYADVKAAIMLLAQQKGHAAALGVLAQFGVSHGNQLKPEQWAPALSALQTAASAASIA